MSITGGVIFELARELFFLHERLELADEMMKQGKVTLRFIEPCRTHPMVEYLREAIVAYEAHKDLRGELHQ